MRLKQAGYFLLFCFMVIPAHSQLPSNPEPVRASLSGFAADKDDAAIPGATILVDGSTAEDHYSIKSDDAGAFLLTGLRPGVSYRVVVQAKGFAAQTFEGVTFTPGQNFEMTGIHLTPELLTSVDAESPQEIAIEEVATEEKQRILGVIPNFYVVYDHNVEPLTTGLKYKLAVKSATDVVSLAAAMFVAGLNQAADTPAYVQGMKGYGQRVGAAYADAASDVLIGGAILPSLLHQDPRYFYQGTGTKKSRFMHAMESPFICRGDDGKMEFNYSSVGGDLISGALTNVYYPPYDRGAALVFDNAGITTGGRILNALAQEFLFSKLTKKK
jgi:hypothetical protein